MSDQKISLLAELTAVNKADIAPVVDGVATTPVTKYATINNLLGTPVDYRDFIESTAPDAPDVGHLRIYAGTDGKLYSVDEDDTVTAIGEGVLSHNVFGRISGATSDPYNIDGTAPVDTLYFSPCNGNMARMYDATLSAWKYLTFSELTLLITDDTQTGDITNGSAVITDLTDTSLLAVDMVVSGTGIPAGAVISTIDSATQITMDQNATATTNDLSDLEFKFPANTNWIFSITLSGGAIAIERPVVYTTQANLLTKITKLDGVKVLDGNTDAIVVGTFKLSTTNGLVDNAIGKRGIRNIYQPFPEGFGWKTVYIPITAMRPADSNGAGAIEELSGGLLVRSFDPDTAQYASIILKGPANWSGVVAPRLYWTVDDANSGDVRWRWRVQAAANGETLDTVTNELIQLDAAPGAAQRVAITALGTAITRTDGDLLRIDLYRDATNAGDDYAADAYGIGLELFFLMHGDGVTAVPA
jgi:hypothetical protein